MTSLEDKVQQIDRDQPVVLIVDDNEMVRRATYYTLLGKIDSPIENYFEAANVEQALTTYNAIYKGLEKDYTTTPFLIFLDLKLPLGDYARPDELTLDPEFGGESIAHYIRRIKEDNHPYIIVQSSSRTQANYQRMVEELQCDDFSGKDATGPYNAISKFLETIGSNQ